MTVKDLRKILRGLPDDMPILEERYSDAQNMDPADWQKRRAIMLNSGADWHRMLRAGEDETDLAGVVNVLYFRGN